MERKIFLLAGVAGLTLALTGCVSHYRDGDADYLKRPDNITRAPYYTDFQIAQDDCVVEFCKTKSPEKPTRNGCLSK